MAFKTVDIDAHVAEPITLIMDEYLDPAFKDRPLRLLKDEKGLEYVEINGKKSIMLQGGAGLGLEAGKGFGATPEELLPFFTPGGVDYYDGMIPAAHDPHARIEWMDAEGVDIALHYPSLGLYWEAECDDPKAAAAYCRAYNDWLMDFCKPYPDRLFPIAHIPTMDVQEAVKEVKRTADLGVKGFMIYSACPNDRHWGDPYFNPLFKEVQETGLPVAPHPTTDLNYMGMDPYEEVNDSMDFLFSNFWWTTQTVAFQSHLALLSMTSRGAFDRFPELKFVLLETGATWIAYWLERMDDRWEREQVTVQFGLQPSEYFQRQCWISFEPEEELIPHVINRWGADRFFWATDFPHHDGYPGVLNKVKALIAPLSEEDQRKVLSENGIKTYNL